MSPSKSAGFILGYVDAMIAMRVDLCKKIKNRNNINQK